MNNQFNKRIDNISIIQNISHVVVCRAIKKFTSAIKVDPTYVRAYVCRGEAYHKIHEVGWSVFFGSHCVSQFCTAGKLLFQPP